MDFEKTKVIADTYKILYKIGAGGGGIIYLAEHIRLDKKVVLKSDKRSGKAKLSTLRREVDSLKGLNNKYIPKVYDFIVEDGIVYTVMDFIEGKSFDFYIKENVKFYQADIIKWTKQILEALEYLHSRPPYGILHADIKPANIMLTAENDAVLIDFNIALALGEEEAVAVGRSHGYASPEHYGLDFTNSNTSEYFSSISKSINISLPVKEERDSAQESDLGKTDIDIGITDVDIGKTEIDIGKTEIDSKNMLVNSYEEQVKKNNNSTNSSQKKITLDKRSDIYSLGATIYHILTGLKPTSNPFDIKPIDNKKFSNEFIKIINKSMMADPNLRYQSANEMLEAINNIHKTDKRSKKIKRKFVVATFFSIILTILGLGITFVGLKQTENLQRSLTLAEYSNRALQEGDIENAIDYALESLNVEDGIFSPPTTAEGQKALTDALGTYKFNDEYRLDGLLNLPSAPLNIEISKDGTLALVQYSKELIIYSIETNKVLYTLKTGESALYEAEFSANGTLIYTSDEGLVAFDLSSGKTLWQNNTVMATNLTVSGNGEVIATINKDEDFATIYNSNGEIIKQQIFDGKRQWIATNDIFVNPNNDIFQLNKLGDKLGISFADGSLWVYDIIDSANDIELYDDTSGFTTFEGGFFNEYFAFSASNEDESIFAVIDTSLFIQVGGFDSQNKFRAMTDDNGIYVQTENLLVKIDLETGEQIPLVTTDIFFSDFSIDNNVTMIGTSREYILFDKSGMEITRIKKESGSNFFDIKDEFAIIGNFNENNVKLLKYYSYDDKNIFEYDTNYLHDEARVSYRYNTLMLFRYNKFFIVDKSGVKLVEVDIPNADNIYDQQFIRSEDDDYLEVTYYDGSILKYSAEDGVLLSEEKKIEPDKNLNEVFEISQYVIEAPLHGEPIVYFKDDFSEFKKLKYDGYLTYVTEFEDKIILQYMTIDSGNYGVLVNDKFEAIAHLPYLSDVIRGELIFDMPHGKIRSSKMFSLDELIELGNAYE